MAISVITSSSSLGVGLVVILNLILWSLKQFHRDRLQMPPQTPTDDPAPLYQQLSGPCVMQSGVQPQVARQVTFVQISLVMSVSESGSAAAPVALFACTRTSAAKAFISFLLPIMQRLE
jgi:hypothetical protein